jgi:hypothetical protein
MLHVRLSASTKLLETLLVSTSVTARRPLVDERSTNDFEAADSKQHLPYSARSAIPKADKHNASLEDDDTHRVSPLSPSNGGWSVIAGS